MAHKRFRLMLAGSALGLAALVAGGAPASATVQEAVGLPKTFTDAHGPGCAGEVWGSGWVYPKHELPGLAGTVTLRLDGWMKVLGVPAPWCSLAPTVRWRNLTTGAMGSASAPLGTPPGALDILWLTAPRSGFLNLETGAGRVEFRLDTDLPHSPSVTVFNVY